MNESSHPRGWSEDVPGAAGEHVLDGHWAPEVNESSHPRGWSEDVPEAAGEHVLDGHWAPEVNESSQPRGWSEDVPDAAGERVLDGHRTPEVSESSQPRGWSEDVPEAAGEHVVDGSRTREVNEFVATRWIVRRTSRRRPVSASSMDGSRAREVNEQSHPRDWSEDVPEAAGEHSAMDPGRARLTSRRSPVDGPEDVLEAAGHRVLDGHRACEVNELMVPEQLLGRVRHEIQVLLRAGHAEPVLAVSGE